MIPVGLDALVHGRTALTGGFGRKSIDLLDNGEKQQKPTFRDLDQRRRLGKRRSSHQAPLTISGSFRRRSV
jgi:hypothetical protein